MNKILPSFSDKNKDELKKMKATAKENISNYLKELEKLKEDIVAKIDKEVKKIEEAEAKAKE
jgi:ElaB/YqjD/DUF883 family membrane-anchored ribosome-binding protein